MSLPMVDSDIDTSIAKISAMLSDMGGEVYLKNSVKALTESLGLASCCVYEFVNVEDGQVKPLSLYSVNHHDLLSTLMPGKQLVKDILESNKLVIDNVKDKYSFDPFLSDQKTSELCAYVLNDVSDNAIGILLCLIESPKLPIGKVNTVIKYYISRINAEVDRVIQHKALNKTRTDFRYLVETSRDLIWEINTEGKFVDVNRSAIMIYGYYPSEMIGRHYSEFMANEDAIEFESYLKKSIEGNGIYDIVANHINKSRRPIQVVYNAKPKYDQSGKHIGFAGTTTDITESVRAQIAIKNNSELFSAILSRLPVVFFRIDENGVLVDIRGQGLQRMGVDDMDWVGRPGYGLFVGMDEMINSALSGETVHFKSRGSYEGEPWWFYTSLFFDSWTGFGAVGFAVDITEQKLGEAKLVQLLKENRELAQHLVEVQEEERRNLARELHDELGQSITAVKSLAKAITSNAGEGYSEVRSLGNSIVDLSGRLYEVVNNIMRRLRPDILDSLGFEETIESCINNSHLERMGVNCNLTIVGEIENLDEIVQITVYRIIQECLTNISKYAMASNIDILIKRKQSKVSDIDMLKFHRSQEEIENDEDEVHDIMMIKVSDDGIGMDLDTSLKSTETEHRMGLHGIKERVIALGGELDIESQPGAGVKITAFIDLSMRENHQNDINEIDTNESESAVTLVH